MRDTEGNVRAKAVRSNEVGNDSESERLMVWLGFHLLRERLANGDLAKCAEPTASGGRAARHGAAEA